MMKLERLAVLLLGPLVGLAVGCALFVDTIPPHPMTHTNMHMMKRRIQRYATVNGSLPTTPDQLPSIEGYANEVTDGWGGRIGWRVSGDEVTLTSFGRDSAPGGSGEDTDLIRVF